MYEPSHVLSKKSTRQHRNVFIWSTDAPQRLAFGLNVDEKSPVTISTLYRWIADAVRHACELNRGFLPWEEADRFILFPVEVRPSHVLSYFVHKNGVGLTRDRQDIISPGDYGLYSKEDPGFYEYFDPGLSFSDMESADKEQCPVLFAKTVLTSSLIQQAYERDGQCIFSGTLPSDADLSATWVFPPAMGYRLRPGDRSLESKYYQDPDGCDFSELMVVENVISCREDIATLFWENRLGIDVDDNYRITVFEGSELLAGGAPLKSHLMIEDGSNRPSDRFLRLHFKECLINSVSCGDVLEDHGVENIENFMEELGVYDHEIDMNDPGWSTPLGMHVHAYLIRRKMFDREMDEEDGGVDL